MLRRLAFILLIASHVLGCAAVASAAEPWSWPVTGPVIQPFDAPASPYATGHRGVDIATPVGTPVVAPAAGVVAFAGPVGGSLYVTLDHGMGVESTYSWLSEIAVRRGAVVGRGTLLASSGPGHAGATPAHLHLGVRVNDAYVDPMDYLQPGSVVSLIRLAPLPAA